jgi:phosphatidylglycerol lysyltransferase
VSAPGQQTAPTAQRDRKKGATVPSRRLLKTALCLIHSPALVQIFLRSGDRILAFTSLVGSAGKAELSVEFVRYIATAPIGILDFVLVEAVLWAKGQHYQTVNLGLAPPRGLGRRDTVSRWNQFGAQLYRHGEHYSDFNELRRAKARFGPRWDPRFVSSRPGLPLARAIPDMAKLVAGRSGAKAA